MYFLMLLCLMGQNVLGQPRFPGLLSDEDLDSFEVTLHPKTQKVIEGSPVVFTCISSVKTKTVFTWRLGYKPVTPDFDGMHKNGETGIHVHQTADNISVLRIDKADVKTHKKKVKCEAAVPSAGLLAKVESSIKIFKPGHRVYYPACVSKRETCSSVFGGRNVVIQRYETNSSKEMKWTNSNIEGSRKGFPTLQSYPETSVIYHSPGRLIISCSSKIGPETKEAPEWRWIKNGTLDIGLYEEMDERLEISDSGTLVIGDVRQSDAGTYECVAENRRGSAYSPPFEVNVVPEVPANDACTDRNGEKVALEDIYQPYSDPCVECACVSGEARYCTTVMCDEPPCRNYELIEGTCCGFRCFDGEEETSVDVFASEAGTCMPYQAGSCREFIQGRNIFIPPQQTQSSLENKLKMLFTGAETLSESCIEYILPFLCFHTVPLCDDTATDPRGLRVCREDCEMVKNKCQDEFIVFRHQSINGTAVLPKCRQLPSRDSEDEDCISFEDFLEPDSRALPVDGSPCRDRYGKSVEHGALYLPDKDPCVACICHDGSRARCTIVACEPPPCRNYIRANDTCCGYTCQEKNATEKFPFDGSCRDFDGSVINEGEQFQPNADPCYQCMCVKGQRRACRTIACEPPSDCANPKPVPGLCCSFTCEEPVLDPDFVRKRKGSCRDFDGSVINEGEQFQPNADPCYQCMCVKGQRRACRTIACEPPSDCANPKPVPDLCCSFTCEEPVLDPDFVRKRKERCVAGNGTYVTNGEYHPGSDPCETCICVNGLKQMCRSVACVPPPCPNPVSIPGVCCEFRCQPPEYGEPCIANNGSKVLNGYYQPGSDPCTTCLCVNGKQEGCSSMGCDPPQDCLHYVPVAGVCCEYQCLEPRIRHQLDSMSPEAPGTLSAQQVGSRNVIVQWKIDEQQTMQRDKNKISIHSLTDGGVSIYLASAMWYKKNSMLTLLYNCTKNGTLTNLTLPSDMTYILLGDLHLNELYTMLLLKTISDRRTLLDTTEVKLDGRAGYSLYLGDVSHGNVYESRGRDIGYRFSRIENRNNVHIMFNSFHHIEMKKTTYPPCQTATGCNLMQFSMYSLDGVLSKILVLMFDDERDFNWAKSHL